MAAKRPTEHDCLDHAQFCEQLDGGVRESGARIALRGIRRVARLAMVRLVEGDEAVVFRDPSLQLMAENATAGRIAMDPEHR